MRFRPDVLAACLVALPCGCTVAEDERSNARPIPGRAPSDPMASFARLVPGEWRQTALRGTSTFDTWHWGPGRHSVRVMTDGASSHVVPEPWRGLQVYYWHPGRREIRLLSASPFARGVGEGTIRFEGETAEGDFDLHQTGVRRDLASRWRFEGPDRYVDELLERNGAGGFEPMNAWVHVRTQDPPAPRDPVTAEAPRHSGFLAALEPLLGPAWAAEIASGAVRLESTLEWIPYADAIWARTVAQTQGAEPVHVLDAYFFHHTGLGRLRCLALSERGGVYEGDVTVLDGGALQVELAGFDEDGSVDRLVRVDFEADGTLRQRDWSIAGGERALVLDVRHRRAPKSAAPAADRARSHR